MFHADPEGILTLTAVLLSWALAIVLYRVGAPHSVARRLALLLVIEGFVLGTSDSLFRLLVAPEALFERYSWLNAVQHVIHTFGDCAMIALYPPFLAAALRSRLTRPFAGRRGMRRSLAFAAVLYAYIQISFLFFGTGEVVFSVLYFFMAVLFLYAFVASIHAWMVASGETRTRARIFTLAFGFRDVCWNVTYLLAMYGTWVAADWAELASLSALFVLYPLGTLIAVPLIAYGILRSQLFDIDLKIRWTLKQSTFAAIVVAITFVVSEGIEMLVAAEMGDFWGLVAAAVAVLFLKPLQAFAERVVSLVMPNTRNTAEYKRSRKLKVYGEAVAEAHAEGGITAKERSLLVRLRDSLDIGEAEAQAIERAVVAGTA